MASASSDPHTVDSFLQRRVTTVIASVAGLSLVFLVYALGECYLARDWERLSLPATSTHAATVVVLTGFAWLSGRGQRTTRQVYWAEAISLLVAAAMLAWLSSYMHVGYRPEFTVLLALTITMAGRSAFVPSSARRTAVLCILLAIPIGWIAWHTYVGYQPPVPVSALAKYPTMSPFGVTVFILVWWAASSVLAVSVSHVIYGLRREVDLARRLGQYTLQEKIGEGGMGQVYRASHAMLRRPTAIKLLVGAGEQQVRRFEREVQLTASLTHPNTIAIMDYGRTPDGVFYYAMEYLDGLNLEDLVGVHGPQPARRVLHVLRQVCGALEEAHAAGLIHRDIKPANIILCKRGGVSDVAKVLDFGLVKTVQSEAQSVQETATDTLMGTPLYMAPESITKPDDVDGRSDLYAVGAVGYFLLTGRPVFDRPSIVEVCAAHLHDEPAAPSSLVDGVPVDLERLLLRCLAKEPKDRLASAAALATGLAACDDAGAWTNEEAAAWWERHHEEHLAASPAGSLVSATVEVALASRTRRARP